MAYPAAQSRFSASAPLPTTPLARRDSARTAPHPSLQQQLFGPPAAGAAPPSIVDRPLARTKGAEVAVGAWAFMFAEIVAYSQSRADSVSDLEARCVAQQNRAMLTVQAVVIRLRCRPEAPPAAAVAQHPGGRDQSAIAVLYLFSYLFCVLSIRLGTQKGTPPRSDTPIHPYAGVPLLLWQGRRRSRAQRRGRK